MIVRCVRITNYAGEDMGATSPWLRVGACYSVLGILGGWKERPAKYLLPSDNPPWWLPEGFEERGDPISVLPSNFAVVSSKLSHYWVADSSSRGAVDIMPEDWLRPDFWESLKEDGADDCVGSYCKFWKLIEAEGY